MNQTPEKFEQIADSGWKNLPQETDVEPVSENSWAGYDLNKVLSYNVVSLLNKIIHHKMEILLYGAGVQARHAISALNSKGIKVDYICDSSSQRHGRNFCGYKIISPSQFFEIEKPTCVFITVPFPRQILPILRAHNFDHVYSCTPLFEDTDFSKIELHNIGLPRLKSLGDLEREISLYNSELLNFESKLKSTELKLKALDVVLTEACSLKCKDCSNLMQYYAHPKNTDLEILFKSLDKIMRAVDFVFEFRIIGGEPFVFKEIFKVVEKLLSYEKFGKIIIYTNGTIVPKDKNLACLKSDKIIVDVSNYGELSSRHDKLINVLERENIKVATKEPTWTDSGRVLPYQERTEEQLKDMFFNCCTNEILTLLHGNLYHCPFSANAENLNAIPHNPSDVIYIPDEVGGKKLRSKIDMFYKKKSYLTACSYCNGRDFNTQYIEVALQTKTTLPLPQIF